MYEIVIPRLGWSMEEGTFVRWLKRDGDLVRRGEPLFELEGEKALQEIEAVDEGILRIPPDAPQNGTVVAVGKVLGFLVGEGESLPASTSTAQGTVPQPVDLATDSPINAARTPTRSATQSVVASPRARRVAKELGVDWTNLNASGTGGRIRECDVRSAIPKHGERSGIRRPISNRRRVIADRLVAGRQQTVPVTITSRADATNLVSLREQFKMVGGATVVPSYQEVITKIVAEVLVRHPILAGRWDGDAIVVPDDGGLHIGMAVDTDDGLLVPVLRDVRALSLPQLAEQSRQFIQRARSGKITAADMQGSVFTITNLGAFGIDAFTPVINSPETAILGLGAIRREPVVLDDGQIVARHQITLSLTFDHRLVDGAPAARFLKDLAAAIANPSAWLILP